MRFKRLQAPAFGPFTNLDLRFSDQPCDFHVIYGANEAGKSSLLRAIRDLLFGVHGHSADNFIHDYAALRIRGEIINRAGEQLSFQRRKGSKNTLLDTNNNPLADEVLRGFLGGVDQSYFSAMFGLGARELHEGAQDLLHGEGDLGQALFSASMGGTPIEKVLEALAAEADNIFKGRATANVSIRPAVNRYKELLGNSRDAMVSLEAWEQVEKGLTEANARKRTLDDEIAALDRDLAWISRCEDALPTVGKLTTETRSLEELPPLPVLASDFVTRARTARQAATKAQDEVQRLTTQIERLRRQQDERPTSPAILTEEDALDQLHQGLGAHQGRTHSHINLKMKLAGLEPLLRAGMKSLGLTGEFVSLEKQRLSSPVRLACKEAANKLKDTLAAEEHNAKEVANRTQQIKDRKNQLSDLPETDLAGLREALTVAAKAIEADDTFSTTELEAKRLKRQAADWHQRLIGAPKDLDATARLPVPPITTIRRHESHLAGIGRDITKEGDKIAEVKKRQKAIQAELARLQRQGELPTEDALRQAREYRDHGWTLVLAEWKGTGAKKELVPGKPLEKAYPQSVAKADEIADQLRSEAEAVAQAEEKRSQLTECDEQVREAKEKIEELQTASAEGQKSWAAEWSKCSITPQSPAEMTEWRDEWLEFTQALAKLQMCEEFLATKTRQILTAKQKLATVLDDSEKKEFSILFEAVKKRVQAGEESAGRRGVLNEQIEKLKNEVAVLKENRDGLTATVTHARKQWTAQCKAVGLPENTSPDTGLALLEERTDLLGKFDNWQELTGEAESIAEAIKKYEQAVAAKARALHREGGTTESLESAMWKALTDARKAQTRHDQLAEQIGEAGDELDEAKVLDAQAKQSLLGLIELAKLVTADELEPLLAQLEKRAGIQQRIHELRETLSSLARGQAVDDFIASVRAEDPDTLARRKSAAARDRGEKESALESIKKTLFQLGTQNAELEKASDAAAEFRQQAEACAASLRRDAARFTRLRLAMYLLQSQIERFRKENQGPLLAKSGAVFNKITCGAFSGLGADFNAEDIPVLVGLRPDESKVSIDGMSDGSRDQLYLALRLAALEQHLETHEPIPLILDDLLMTFDNNRAKAILPQLHALAQRTQIFLFTHHEHIVELCRQTLGDGQFQLHRLGTQSDTTASSVSSDEP